MTQKVALKYISTIKRFGEQESPNRFVFSKRILIFSFLFSLSCMACEESEIKLNRADRNSIDTLVNNQLDSISPILDSICQERRGALIKKTVDSIIIVRKKKEERLRLKLNKTER